jgi:hypothetical protein
MEIAWLDVGAAWKTKSALASVAAALGGNIRCGPGEMSAPANQISGAVA